MYKTSSKLLQARKEIARPSLRSKNRYGTPLYERQPVVRKQQPDVIFLSEEESDEYRRRIAADKERDKLRKTTKSFKHASAKLKKSHQPKKRLKQRFNTALFDKLKILLD